jgi:hypothetical protein
MSIENPLTASSVIQRTTMPKPEQFSKKTPLTPNLGVYSQDIVEISKLGLEKQQKETQIEATNVIKDVANEVIKISSTIGKAKALGNLTNSQATDLYNKISQLL